jgi:hypothetical protein
MKFKSIISTIYLDRKRKKKINEQLQIGKVKFEVIPVYINKVCVHSIFQLKYSPVTPVGVSKSNYQYLVIKILVGVIFLTLIYILTYNILVTLGIIALVNESFITAIAPYVFNGISTSNIPQLTLLLQKVNLLNP